MEAEELNTISTIIGIIIGFLGSYIANALYNVSEYLRYEVYKKEKEFKNTKKIEKNAEIQRRNKK